MRPDQSGRMRAFEFSVTELVRLGTADAGVRCGAQVDRTVRDTRQHREPVVECRGILVDKEGRVDGERVGVCRGDENGGRRRVRRRNPAEGPRSQCRPQAGCDQVLADGLLVQCRQR